MNGRIEASALTDGTCSWTYAALDEAVSRLAARLRHRGVRVLATLIDNSPAWVIADLAAAQARTVHIPLPLFFSPDQIGHALREGGADTLITLPSLAARWPDVSVMPVHVAGDELAMLTLPHVARPLPPGTVKITFTSGTTGSPKGVCLGPDAMEAVAAGLVSATESLGIERHLCALPFAVLLENIAGLAAPMRHGATCIVLPLRRLGLNGSSSFDAAVFHDAISLHRPESVILLPQMLRAWVSYLLHSGKRAPASLRMVAVGGAAVGDKLVRSARALGIPAYEGYGLSEGASVQTLNLPDADRPGSAGRPLPHTNLRVRSDGEIEVRGSLFAGYIGDSAPAPTWWPTGDLGHIDGDGFLHIRGRKKNLLITAYGRNVSPEWVETSLRCEAEIVNAVVFGDMQPLLSAVIWPLRANATDAELQSAVDAANAELPDYARVHRWVRAAAAFDASSGMATANGRPRRDAIHALHRDALGIADL